LLPISFKRTLANVGHANGTYKATVYSPDNVSISVDPKQLTFSGESEVLSFTLTVSHTNIPVSLVDSSLVDASTTVFGFLQWSDGEHVVQSPIAITLKT